jgi:serine/threonine protein kinase
MWSVGVIIFVLLCGYPPFADENQNALFEKVRCGEYAFHDSEWKHVSDDAKELIRNLLVVDPCRRWTARQALRSKWLHQPDEMLESADLTENLHNIKKKRSRLRAVAKAVIIANSLGDSLRDLSMVENLLSRPDELEGADDPEKSHVEFEIES